MEAIVGLLVQLDLHFQREGSKARLRTRKNHVKWDGTTHTKEVGHMKWHDLKINMEEDVPRDKMKEHKIWDVNITQNITKQYYDLHMHIQFNSIQL